MNLTFEQVKQITSGYLCAEKKEDGIHFYRFTKEQTAYYKQTSEDFYEKTYATPGVRFDFITDAECFAFSYKVSPASSRGFYFFDIYIDGILTDHKGEKNMWINQGKVEVVLPEGEHRLTVWFPCLSSATINDVSISDNACFKPYSYSKTLLCFGDSITQGYDAEYPSLAYANAIANGLDAFVINQAIGGEKFAPELFTDDLTFSPDIVTIAYGTNDWTAFTRDVFFDRCNGFLENIKKKFPKSKIIVITPIWRADKIYLTSFGSFDEAVKYIADKALSCGLNVIDGNDLTPHYFAFYSDLFLHPNDLGFAEYAKNLMPKIKELL